MGVSTMNSGIQRAIHDIRNPLNNISVNAELGKLTLARTGDADKVMQILDLILKECRDCSDEIDKLKEQIQDIGAA